MSTCPKCSKSITQLRGQEHTLLIGHPPLKAISMNCPECDVLLSCQIDPISIKSDIVNELLDSLRQDEK